VEREERSGCYRIGLSALELAQKFIKTASLIQHARPIMEVLARKHDEAVYMTVLKDDEVLFIDMVDCDRQIKAAPMIGKRFPFFTNAAGKVIKAVESRDLLQKVWARNRSMSGTLDFSAFEQELNDIREKGVAIDNGGLGDDIVSVAVAVKDYAGKIVGALTMLAPSFRMVTERLEQEIIPSLLESAEILSMKFGHARI
jgi:DNA-binding IclR family transcriptional regulator